MGYPSIKTLTDRLNIRPDTAKAIRRAMEDYTVKSALDNINAFLDGFGVESIGDHSRPEFDGIEYVNLGDTYAPTVMFDHRSGRYIVGCWGDLVERQPRRFRD
jgi:hypothetical protein